jgi:hypothetical protein
VRFQVLTAASKMFRIVFWDVLPCKIVVIAEAVRTPETSVGNYFTRQYIPEDNSERSLRGSLYITFHIGLLTLISFLHVAEICTSYTLH